MTPIMKRTLVTHLTLHAERTLLDSCRLDVNLEITHYQLIASQMIRVVERTLGSLVKPVSGHSLTSLGVSMEETFAFSMNGSLMMFTVKPLVSLMFLKVSFSSGSTRLCAIDTDKTGGKWVT